MQTHIHKSCIQDCIQDFFSGEGGGGGGGGGRIRLRSRISDISLARLTIGDPELASVDFEEYSCNG